MLRSQSSLYYVLKEAGLAVQLVQGTVYNKEAGAWAIDGTHVAMTLNHHNERYLIDAGFGVNLPLQPVPLRKNGSKERQFSFESKKRKLKRDASSPIR
ncbi:arylamine N-acetyltransferase [Bacillus sp. SL00103]